MYCILYIQNFFLFSGDITWSTVYYKAILGIHVAAMLTLMCLVAYSYSQYKEYLERMKYARILGR